MLRGVASPHCGPEMGSRGSHKVSSYLGDCACDCEVGSFRLLNIPAKVPEWAGINRSSNLLLVANASSSFSHGYRGFAFPALLACAIGSDEPSLLRKIESLEVLLPGFGWRGLLVEHFGDWSKFLPNEAGLSPKLPLLGSVQRSDRSKAH